MDLISIQAVIDALNGTKFDVEYCTEYGEGYNDGIDDAVSRLSALLPTQPEIVRCKDCIFRADCEYDGSRFGDDDFCSRGERKEK